MTLINCLSAANVDSAKKEDSNETDDDDGMMKYAPEYVSFTCFNIFLMNSNKVKAKIFIIFIILLLLLYFYYYIVILFLLNRKGVSFNYKPLLLYWRRHRLYSGIETFG